MFISSAAMTAPANTDGQCANLSAQLSLMAEQCIRCPKCKKECAFLNQNGDPGFIAENFTPADSAWLNLAFDCSLCGLCAAVCPVHLSPVDLFLAMRREAVARGVASLTSHKGIMAYERRGMSKKYSWYSLPENCQTVFFPGCTFAGTRMDTTIALYEHLKRHDSGTGIVLDCCCKPSHDLGRDDFFHEVFSEMKNWLVEKGVKTVIVACPNCYKVLSAYGEPLKTVSVYEFLFHHGMPLINRESREKTNSGSRQPVAIHDPCVLRNEDAIQAAVRNLAEKSGFSVEEMPHSRKKTLCCGEGGSVGFVTPEFSAKWGGLRREEAGDRRLLTYCAGCAAFLNRRTPTDHILDAIFYPEAVAAGKRKATKPPITYFNRLRLKKYLQENHPAAVTRERDFIPTSGKADSSGKNIFKIMILILIAVAIGGIRLSGLHEHFDADTLRQAVASLGPLAPVAYIILYTIAPSMFLPGLPITIVGGIIFGPVWGVIYTITGATAGACLAFLLSRYVARDWTQAKLSGPRWQRLNRSVEKNGWKIVAFTRLVPLFPFNLLNYAFGLTPIKLLPYAVTTFFCMLPACIAFIVFSSSFLDLLKGEISPTFLIGILLIVLVSLIPFIIRKIRPQQGKGIGLS